MGSFNPISLALSTLGTVLTGGNAARRTSDAYRQADDVYRQQAQEIEQDRKTQLEKLELDRQNNATKRRDALKRAMSKQQAIFGGQGIDTTDGSGEAVLLGLLKNNDDDRAYSDKLDALKRGAIEEDAENKRKRNLLNLQSNYNSATNTAVSGYNTILNSANTFSKDLSDE